MGLPACNLHVPAAPAAGGFGAGTGERPMPAPAMGQQRMHCESQCSNADLAAWEYTASAAQRSLICSRQSAHPKDVSVHCGIPMPLGLPPVWC